jgi:hypothetical protein
MEQRTNSPRSNINISEEQTFQQNVKEFFRLKNLKAETQQKLKEIEEKLEKSVSDLFDQFKKNLLTSPTGQTPPESGSSRRSTRGKKRSATNDAPLNQKKGRTNKKQRGTETGENAETNPVEKANDSEGDSQVSEASIDDDSALDGDYIPSSDESERL